MPITVLAISREDAASKLDARIERGRELIARAESPITDSAMRTLCDDKNSWSKSNIGFLTGLVNNDTLTTEYGPFHELRFGVGVLDLTREVDYFIQYTRHEIDTLSHILERLDMMQEPERAPSAFARPFLLDIFISHSSHDAGMVKLLIDLLRTALSVRADKIRCTSVDGYRLPGGARTEEQLRSEVLEAKVFIGVITPEAVTSPYVLFELGARWGVQLPLLPVLAAGATPTHLGGPLGALNALNCSSEGETQQLVTDVADYLDLVPGNPASYLEKLKAFVAASTASGDVAGSAEKPTFSTATATAMSPDDSVSILVPYLSNLDPGHRPFAVRYDEADKELGLLPGTTRQYINEAVELAGLEIQRLGEQTALLARPLGFA